MFLIQKELSTKSIKNCIFHINQKIDLFGFKNLNR